MKFKTKLNRQTLELKITFENEIPEVNSLNIFPPEFFDKDKVIIGKVGPFNKPSGKEIIVNIDPRNN